MRCRPLPNPARCCWMRGWIELTPGFPVFLVLLRYFAPGGAFWPFLAAMAVHELAHTAMLLLLGGKIEGLRLGFAQLTLRTGLLSLKTELTATAAGPVMNLLCTAALGRTAPEFAAASLLLGAFNLLPLWPLDGGRILRSALTARFGDRGEAAAYATGLALSGALLLAAVYMAVRLEMGVWPVLTALLLVCRLRQMQRREKAVAFPGTRR